jgi:hypothetical protein
MAKKDDPEVLAREAEVLKLRRGGLTFDVIAQRVGYANPGSAQKAYERSLTRVTAEDAAVMRQVENDRLDMAQSAIWVKVLQGDNQSISNLLRIMDRRAKLNGLDVPVRIQAEVVSYDIGSVDANLAAIVNELANSKTSSRLVGIESEEGTVTE